MRLRLDRGRVLVGVPAWRCHVRLLRRCRLVHGDHRCFSLTQVGCIHLDCAKVYPALGVCVDGHIAVTRVSRRQTATSLRQQAVLSQSILLHSQFPLVQAVQLGADASDLGAERLKGPLLGHFLLVGDARDHRVLVVVVLLPGDQVVLIHLLLHVGHVSVGAQHTLPLNLVVQVVLVLVLLLLVQVSAPLVKHAVEEAGPLGLLRIVLLLHTLGLLLGPFVVLHLAEQLSLMLVAHPRLIVLSLLGTLVQELLVGHGVPVLRL